jgi:hypothetical protein
MMQKIIHCGVVAVMMCLLSVSAAQFDVAQAQRPSLKVY